MAVRPLNLVVVGVEDTQEVHHEEEDPGLEAEEAEQSECKEPLIRCTVLLVKARDLCEMVVAAWWAHLCTGEEALV